jgi:energy-coupling factor transporter ATP-binding protein EcfA2
MLVSFSVSNFRSFDGEQTFSLVASNRLSAANEGHTAAIPNSASRALRAGVIYGANGAGKSNLFRALQLLKTIATSTREKDAQIRREPFRFAAGLSKPTILDLQFVVRKNLFRYGVKLDDTQVLEEWLIRVSQGNEEVLYERMSGSKGEVRVELGKTLRSNEKIVALATIGGPRNQSFLTTVWSNIDDLATIPFELLSAYFWIGVELRLISPQQTDPDLNSNLVSDPELLGFASQFLRSSSTGIDHLALAPTPLSEEDFAALVPDGWMQSLSSLPENASREYGLPNEDVAKVERSGGLRYSRLRLQAAHKTNSGEVAPLDLQDESDGTRRLLELLPALHSLRQENRVFFIDEVDRSLHPMLVRSFLEYFLNSCEGDQRQLIMTTHESSLLDQELLRRDEIWFAEKDAAGATSLYSLLDFKVRNDLEIRKHYLQGRFGAVPFLGGVQRLMEEEGQPA